MSPANPDLRFVSRLTRHRHCRIKRAIIDRDCRIPEDMVIGHDAEKNRQHGFRVTDQGITLVTPDMLGQPLHFNR